MSELKAWEDGGKESALVGNIPETRKVNFVPAMNEYY